MKRIDDDSAGCGGDWSESVSALVTGAPVDDARKALVAAHLASCPACREHAERLAATIERVRAAAPRDDDAFAFDPERRAALLAAAGAAIPVASARWRSRLLPIAAAAGALVALVATGAVIWTRRAGDTDTAPRTLSLDEVTFHFDQAEGWKEATLRGYSGTNGQVPSGGRTPSDPTPPLIGAATEHYRLAATALQSMGYVSSPQQPLRRVTLPLRYKDSSPSSGRSRLPQLLPTANPADQRAGFLGFLNEELDEEESEEAEILVLETERLRYVRDGAAPSASSEYFLTGFDGFVPTDSNATTPRDDAAARAAISASAREAVRQYLKAFERRPGERPREMFHRFFGDNPAVRSVEDALSTFAIDVDTASYTLARKSLLGGVRPSRYSVRTEEFVNYFPAETAPPRSAVFAIATDAYSSPFLSGPNSALLRVVVKGRDVATPDRKPLALTFVIDVSGSMQQDDRLGLVKGSLDLLVNELDERDTVAIVSFASDTATELAATSGAEKDAIRGAIEKLSIRGGTNTFAGLLLGYETATENLREGAMNRVILCSDGVANEGETSVEKMLEAVREHKERGIFVNTIGVGMGHVNDALLEQFANQGDGVCNYVDDLTEARRVFVTRLTGTLETIAKDVKIQVAFEPNAVATWRQIGYENRAVADEDFRNDAVDGGEVGAGHEVVALYEIETQPGVASESLGKVSVRWKDPASGEVSESEEKLAGRAAANFDAAPSSFRLHALVAEFAEILRESVWARGSRLEDLAKRFEPLVAAFDHRADVVEAAALVKQAALLAGKATAEDEARSLADDLAQNALLRARLADSGKPEDAAKIAELETQAREIEAKLGDRLVKTMTGDESATLDDRADLESTPGSGLRRGS